MTRPIQPSATPLPQPAAAPRTRIATLGATVASVVRDSFQATATLRNDRFAGIEALDRVARGGAPLGKADAQAVAAVQDTLLAMAFFVPGGADGVFGPGTARAVKNFQTAAGLPATGELDAKTLRQLDRLAPSLGKTAWDPGADRSLVPDPVVRDAKGNPYMEKGPNGKKRPMIARVVVAIGQHRVFSFDKQGNLQKIYAARTGTANHADGRGAFTQPAVKRIDTKMAGVDLANLGQRLWEAPGAFGEGLIALSKIDPATRKTVPFPYNGQELHGVPNNSRGEPTGLGADFSHGCVGISNDAIKEISAGVRAGEIVNFIP